MLCQHSSKTSQPCARGSRTRCTNIDQTMPFSVHALCVDSEADGEPSKVTKTKEIRLLGARSTAKSSECNRPFASPLTEHGGGCSSVLTHASLHTVADAGKAWYPNGDSYEGGFFQVHVCPSRTSCASARVPAPSATATSRANTRMPMGFRLRTRSPSRQRGCTKASSRCAALSAYRP
eukprot:scaffold9176_cov32-Tisochrysis_lutea.AAC.1